MFDILNTINTETITELGKEPRKNKGLTEEKDTQQFKDITPDNWSENFILVKIKSMKNSHC